MPSPKLSVITINLNNKTGLQKTMESVFAQTFTDYEYIIIDGGSEDGSAELIKKHQNKFVYWVSEKDEGIYQAMNKGILKANGEYLLFLNSEDYLIDNYILDKIGTSTFNLDIVYGKLLIEEKNKKWEKEYPVNPTFKYFFNDSIPHSGGAFLRKELFTKIGLYDENLLIASDWKFYLKAIFNYNATIQYIDELIAVFSYNGISSKNLQLLQQEKESILISDFGFALKVLDELSSEKQKNKLLLNSRVIKAYFKMKSMFLSR
jgi:glycosyltransferase involved in cell wall biosynthesis